MESITSHDWIKVWSTKFSFLNLYCFVSGFTNKAYDSVGKGFDHILFSYRDSLATVYRINQELQEVCRYYAEEALKDASYLQRSIDALDLISEEVNTLCETGRLFTDIETFRSYRSKIEEFLPHYLVMLWTYDGLEMVEVNQGLKSQLQTICRESRQRTEKFFPGLEKFLDTQLAGIDNKIGSNYGNLLLVLTPQELEAFILNQILPLKEELLKRQELSIIYGEGKGVELFVGEEAREIFTELEATDKNIKEFKGTISMKGKVQGKARVVFKESDLESLEDGDILVTTMTRPEWVVAMKRAGAFVTDAGGLLCHAAIVARELGTPCIIGTQVATRVLKDGDLIEVDADRGVVRVLI